MSQKLLWGTSAGADSPAYIFRPIVTLNSNSELTGSSKDGWNVN